MTPELRITVLMENTAREGLEAEHGLSFFLEYRGRRFLLDAGSSGRFADNAQKLGVDLDGVELAALSHGHYDHADGLRAFFALNDRAPVYIRPQAGEAYYSKSGGVPQICGHPSGDLGGLPGPLRAGGWAVPPLPRGLAGAGDRPGRALCQPGAQSAAQGGGGPAPARRLFPRAVHGAGDRAGAGGAQLLLPWGCGKHREGRAGPVPGTAGVCPAGRPAYAQSWGQCARTVPRTMSARWPPRCWSWVWSTCGRGTALVLPPLHC